MTPETFMAKAAALALRKVEPLLAEAVREEPGLRGLLKSDGGFLWRRVAGEQRLSPHAYGVALDLSARGRRGEQRLLRARHGPHRELTLKVNGDTVFKADKFQELAHL